ncbi:MAG: AMP-binding protein [Turneriella sp.]
MKTIPEIFYDTVGDFSEKTAFIFIDKKFSYGEYNALSNRVAHALIASGLRPGDRVAIHLPNLPQYLVFMMGALKAGCVISGLSPLATPREIEIQLKDLDAAALISFDDVYAKHVQALLPALPGLKTIVITRPLDLMPFPIQFFARLLGKVPHPHIALRDSREVWFEDFCKGFAKNDVLIPRTANDTAAIQYTGGTTGLSKGAMLSHANILSNIEQSIAVTHPEKGRETGLSILPFFHIAGLTAAFNTIVIGGAWILIPNPRDLEFIVRQLKAYHPSLIFAVPLLYEKILTRPDFQKVDFSKLKFAMSGAAPMSDALKQALEAVIRVPVLEGYGMTEASPGITINYPGRVKAGTVGQALPGTEVKIVSLDGDTELGAETEGQLIASGPQVMPGYWNKPDETQAVLKTRQGKTWLYSGDIARMDNEGYITIVDRIKDMINVGGYKVFSVEVEAVLCTHPAIACAAILGSADGATEVVKLVAELKAAYKSADREEIQGDILRFCRKNLAAYKIPGSIEFVETIPVTPIGKVDKKALRAQLAR